MNYKYEKRDSKQRKNRKKISSIPFLVDEVVRVRREIDD